MAFTLILIPFFIVAIYVLICIYKTLTVDKVMQSVYWLILMMVGVSLLFLMANSEILFAYQLMVYSGGIAVLLLFAGLLTTQDELFIDSSLLGFARSSMTQLVLLVIFAIDILVLAFGSIGADAYSVSTVGNTDQTYTSAFEAMTKFATYLWEDLGGLVIILGFTLLAAILGSVKLAIRETDLEELSDEYMARLKLREETSTPLPGMENIEVEA